MGQMVMTAFCQCVFVGQIFLCTSVYAAALIFPIGQTQSSQPRHVLTSKAVINV